MAQLQISHESLRVVSESAPPIEIAWGEVEWVIAYLKDCYSVDQLRMEFGTETRTVIVVEEDEGFDQLLNRLPSVLHGFPPEKDWFNKAIQPPFSNKVTTLYRRSALAT